MRGRREQGPAQACLKSTSGEAWPLGAGDGHRGQPPHGDHLPVLLLATVAVFIIRIRTGAWASLGDSVVFPGSTALVVTWYTSIALLASSYARDQGTAIAFGVGVWFLFTMLWLLVTSVLAALVASRSIDHNAQWAIRGRADLLLQTASTITSSNSA